MQSSAETRVQRNPKDSMRSTWRNEDPSQWGYSQRSLERLRVTHIDLQKSVPLHAKDDKVPRVPHWHNHRWVLLHAAWPLAIHQAYVYVTKQALHPILAFILYMIAFSVNGVLLLQKLRNLGHLHGFLDGDKHARDEVPDHSVGKVLLSLRLTGMLRPLITVFFAYNRALSPLSISPWIILEIGLYAVILDFWFYWYHRVMHEVNFLWKFHRTHHLTKHPNALLTLYADVEQEICDMVLMPLLTYGTMKAIGLPMGFYEWWICHQYEVFTELWGHSGLRVLYTPPTTLTWFLRLFDAELIVEDHDLHHRNGWKQSFNYGKQTRLWDVLFGTTTKRFECKPQNIDPKDFVALPIF